MEALIPVFQTDSEEVNKVYNSYPNYLIEYSDHVDSVSANETSYCILYFSSNDIYYPNSNDAFQNQLVKKNRFEWYGTRVLNGKKHIFLRDIKKQWYLTGINNDIDTIEKLRRFLEKETEGYNTITVGSSAGGYAAVLFGAFLNAEIVFTFNGQFHLDDLLSRSTEYVDPIVFRERNNPEINQYYSLRNFIKSTKAHIAYFYSNKSDWDIDQFNHVSDLEMNVIPFKTSHHGIPFLKSSLKYVINYPCSELEKLNMRPQNPLVFSLRIEGLLRTFMSIVNQAYKYMIRKMRF